MRQVVLAEGDVVLVAPVNSQCVVADHLQEDHDDRVLEELEVERETEAQALQLF